MSILAIIDKVAATSSKNEKVAILTENKDNELLKQVLVACYDPTINYWIKKIPVYNDESVVAYHSLKDALSALGLITNRILTGNAAIKHLTDIIMQVNQDDGEIVKRIILRDMRAGFSASTINKVWKNLIKETPYMRCSVIKELKGKNTLVKWPWTEAIGIPIQTKEDGMFSFVNHYNDNEITINSRSGSIFDNAMFQPLFIGELRRLIPTDMQTHGEFLVMQAGKVLPREVGNGIMNKVLKGSEFPTGTHPLYVVWDMIPIVAAVPGGRYNIPYHERLTQVVECFYNKSAYVMVVDTKHVHSYDEAMSYYTQCLAKGLEGAVLKHPDMIWEDTTSRGQVKLKLTFSVELEVVAKIEGKGKYKGMLGALECKSSCGKLIVNVSGFTDKQRKDYWESDDEVSVGSIIQVKANNISQNNGVYSLFLPVIEQVRLDKSSADSLEQIIAIYESAIRP